MNICDILPFELWKSIYDFLDEFSLVAFHSTTVDLRSQLPHKIPVPLLKELHEMMTEVLGYTLGENQNKYIMSISRWLHSDNDALKAMSEIRSIKMALLKEVVEPPSPFTLTSSVNDVKLLFKHTPKERRWYHVGYCIGCDKKLKPATPGRNISYHSKETFKTSVSTILKERKPPPCLKEVIDQSRILNNLKKFCGKTYYVNSNWAPATTYNVLTEEVLYENMKKPENQVMTNFYMFSEWTQDKNTKWRILLISVVTGVLIEHVSNQQSFNVLQGFWYTSSVGYVV